MKVVAFLPVKGQSNRIENKNLKLLDGIPLFLHTLKKLLTCEFISEVYLDTESEEIMSLASYLGCKILRRDPRLANNSTDGNRLFINEVNHINADLYIQILGTSPFIETNTIKKGVDDLLKSNSPYDSAVLVRKERQYVWAEGKPSYDIENIPNSIDLGETTIETMGLYIVKRDTALRTKRRIGDRPLLLEASALEAIDVNWPDDFELANLVASGQREKKRRMLSNLKHHLTSSLLSDVLDDLGQGNQIITGLSPNIPNSKILGYSKTLKLRNLGADEDFSGIYDALNSYNSVVPGDVIMVENDASAYAYFGELNANLAIRCGAAGAIIGGKTRDSPEVTRLGFQVFSRGYTCKDVRRRATTESINLPIAIENVPIFPNDLVFADNEGVVVIPSALEALIVEEVFRRSSTEKRILLDLSKGMDTDRLITSHGAF